MITFPGWELSGWIALAYLAFYSFKYPAEMWLVITLKNDLEPLLNVLVYALIATGLNMIILKG